MMNEKRFLALLVQLDRMAINGWSEGIDPRGQCQNIHERIKEWVECYLEDLK